jgi:hypothetical protein
MRGIPLIIAAVALGGALAPAAAMGAGSAGVSGPSFYVDSALYRTVGTPTDLSGTGAPEQSFDTIYSFDGLQPNVAETGPGEPGYNGGRWRVRPLSFNSSYAQTVAAHDSNASGDLDSNEEVEAALADAGAGGATLGGIASSFECPVIQVPASHS